jgi:hypothetical protein
VDRPALGQHLHLFERVEDFTVQEADGVGPISMPKKIAQSSQTLGLVKTDPIDIWDFVSASARISAATVARSFGDSHFSVLDHRDGR